MIEVEIDKDSGFCFGVVTAIESAERELGNTDTLYCLCLLYTSDAADD